MNDTVEDFLHKRGKYARRSAAVPARVCRICGEDHRAGFLDVDPIDIRCGDIVAEGRSVWAVQFEQGRSTFSLFLSPLEGEAFQSPETTWTLPLDAPVRVLRAPSRCRRVVGRRVLTYSDEGRLESDVPLPPDLPPLPPPEPE